MKPTECTTCKRNRGFRREGDFWVCTRCQAGFRADRPSERSERPAGGVSQHRPLYSIADDIQADWKNVYFGAQPYLDAMLSLDSIKDMYGVEDAETIVLYFLSNATSWRGPVARQIKAELRGMLHPRRNLMTDRAAIKRAIAAEHRTLAANLHANLMATAAQLEAEAHLIEKEETS